MADNKKSIVLYTDLIHTFEELSDQEAGVLVKHLFRYVNDMDPDPPDRLTKIAFEPIKQQLKRDLAKWEGIRGRRAEAGKLGGVRRAENLKQTQATEANATSDKQNQAKTT